MPRAALILLSLSALSGTPLSGAPLADARPQQQPGDPNLPPEASPPPVAGTTRFRSRQNTFQIDLPEGWRQLAPREAQELRESIATLPLDVGRNEPSYCYAIGPVDRWLAGDFDGRYLYVVEQGNEWTVDEEFEQRLRQMWSDKGRNDGVEYVVEDIRQVEIGRNRHAVTSCRRRSTPRPTGAVGTGDRADRPDRAQLSLDVYAPTGGRQVSLSFTCWADEFDDRESDFRAMMATVTFARRAKGEATLGDRLWTPILTGSLVGLALIVLYRWTRRRPLPGARPPVAPDQPR